MGRNGSLRAGFFRDVRKVDRAKKVITEKEIEILCYILREGVEQDIFAIEDIRDTAYVITLACGGMDVSYIRDSLREQGLDKFRLTHCVCDVIINGIKKK